MLRFFLNVFGNIYGFTFCSPKTNLLSLQMKEVSDLDSWKSHVSMQLDHVLRNNAVLR